MQQGKETTLNVFVPEQPINHQSFHSIPTSTSTIQATIHHIIIIIIIILPHAITSSSALCTISPTAPLDSNASWRTLQGRPTLFFCIDARTKTLSNSLATATATKKQTKNFKGPPPPSKKRPSSPPEPPRNGTSNPFITSSSAHININVIRYCILYAHSSQA